MANALMVWEDSYCLGLDEIDEQHRSLVNIINQIWESIVDKSNNEIVFSLIDELEKYTLAHFTAEETFMQLTRYSELAKHKIEHREFVARISDEKAHAVATGQLSLDLMYFLRNWLVQHILVSDKQYADETLRDKTERSSLISRLFRRFF